VRSVNVSCKTRRDRTPASRAMAARYTTGAKAGRRRNSPNRLPEDVSRRGPTRTVGGIATPSEHQKRIHRESLFLKKLDPPYEEYWSKELVQQGLKRGELIQVRTCVCDTVRTANLQ